MAEPINFGVMLINLAGGLALFLYGMHKMTEALRSSPASG
jgi:Na+/phosphate symporter